MIDSDIPSGLDKLDMVKDTLTVKRVFGEAYQADGAVIIPVASVRGGGGGGVGQGRGPGDEGSGTGQGLGFGVRARAIGVYVARDGRVEWQPAVDVTRIAVGGQILAFVALLVLRSIVLRRRRR